MMETLHLTDSKIMSNLDERARQCMAEHGVDYDGVFVETFETPIKFNGVAGHTRPRCWLRCHFITDKPENLGLCITFGVFDPKFPDRVTETFFHGVDPYSHETSEDFKARVEKQKKAAAKKEKEDKELEKKKVERLRERYDSASPEGNSLYFERKKIPPPSDIHYETHTSYEDGVRVDETIALIPLRNIGNELIALQEVYPSKRLISPKEKKPRDKNFIGKNSGCFYTFGELVDGQDIFIAEGVTTAGSIHLASEGKASIAAMSRGNLLPVGLKIKEKYPSSELTICADNDHATPGNPGVTDATKAAKLLGCGLCVVDFPEGIDGTDYNDLHVNCGLEAVAEQLKNPQFFSPSPHPDEVVDGGFLVEPGKTHLAADKGIEILSNPECRVFQQQGRTVRIVEFQTAPKKKKKDVIKRPDGALAIEQCDEVHLVNVLSRRSTWEKIDGRSKINKQMDFPDKAAKMILDMKGRDLPYLKGFICSPTLRPDGSLLEDPGYDEESGLFFNPCGTNFPKIPKHPTKEDAAQALGVLLDLIKDFPFADAVSRSVALAEMFTAVVRRSLDLSPGFANDASTRSSGKTLLAKLSAYIATGREPTMIIPTPNDEEMGKRLGAAFLAGDPIICIDNIDFPFDSRDMCIILTASSFNPRILGQSKSPNVDTNSQVIFTGNNLLFCGDICTRTLVCRILPDCEHPEERKFDRNLEDYTPKNREKFVVAILTIMRAYVAEGFPGLDSLPEFRTYSTWTKFVREPLVWLGERDPYESAKGIKENDPEKEEMSSLLHAWYAAMKHLPMEDITLKDLLKILSDTSRKEKDEALQNLYDILLDVAPDSKNSIDAKKLGNKIQKHKDRIIDGYRLTKVGESQRASKWKVSRVTER